MKSSYTKNYLNIYFWQGIALILNFLSMFIVVPYLTSEPSIYGIYTVCISISIFLAYADLGFMGAGQKYAAEHFARGETDDEIKVIGFTSFILLIFLLVFSLIFFYLSTTPYLLIRNLTSVKEVSIASSLLMILALFVPVTFLQRILQMIFGIRLEDYIIQRTNIIGSLFKIGSVLWFFGGKQYNIVGYFLFTQLVNFTASIITLIIARKRYGYNFKRLAANIRFNKLVFSKTKNLAFTSLYLTVTWILYYELDPTVIGKFIGIEKVAIYAIGLTILSFFRSVLGILFSPFNVRFNHFIGINDTIGLKTFFLHVIIVLAPIVVIPILTVFLLAKPLILTWVGVKYINSVMIVKLLVLCNLFAFISYPAGMLLMAQEQVKKMYFISTMITVLFWSGIILTYSFFGLLAFAIFKLIVFVLSAIVYYYFVLNFLKINIKQSIKYIFQPLLYPLSFLFILAILVRNFLPYQKSKLNLLIVGLSAGLLVLGSFIIQYFSNPKIKEYFNKLFSFKTYK